MAVCKRCGCAIPLGSKACDLCALTGSIAPVGQPVAWQPPKDAAAPTELASSAASWAAPAGAARPTLSAQVQKAHKQVRAAWQFIAFVGALTVTLGLVAELGTVTFLLNYFDWFSVAEGVIFLTLAWFIRGGSVVATVIAAALYILDTVALLFIGHFGFFRIFIIAFLLRSVGSAFLLRQQRRSTSAQDQSRAA